MDTRNIMNNRWKLKSTQLFVVAGIILMSLSISILCVGLTVRYEVDTETTDVKSIQYWKLNLSPEQEFWYEKSIEELRSIILKKEERGEVENVIIFLAQGVTSEMLSRARFVNKGDVFETKDFIWDTFPHLGLLKSSCIYGGKCDAFTLSTALFGGVKTYSGLGGLDRRASAGNCYQALNESFHINSIFKEAKALNIRTGFVTTKRVSGPLVAGLYAHSSDTKWECEGYMPKNLTATCLDVASQLLTSQEGTNINVIMGGGRQTLVSMDLISKHSPYTDESACISSDKRDLLQHWQSLKLKENVSFELMQSSGELETLKGSHRDYVLGIFANGDLTAADPTLLNMITKSLDVLKRNNSRYILVAETAVKTDAAEEVQNLHETLWELNETIKSTLKSASFTPHNTVLLTVFLDLNTTASVPQDILLYARGPKSNLFHGVHEETYMAHVISYYLKMGIFKSSKN